MNPRKTLLFLCMIALLIFTAGCKRTPEDLEKWRNAQGGMEQLIEWASSSSEPVDVRIRAFQILIEEGHSAAVPRALDRIEDQVQRQEIATAIMPSIEEMWAAQDQPQFTQELREQGGDIMVGPSKTIDAKDALYRLYPYFSPDAQTRTQEILREWMSDEQELRTQLGDATIPMLLPLAGPGAAELLSDWIKETYDPRKLADELREYASDDDHLVIDKAVAELALSEHPDLRRETQHAVVGAKSPGINPYLEQAIMDPAISGELLQASIDTYGEVNGADSVEFFARVVAEKQGVLRWAAANSIIDAKKVQGLVDLGRALPTDTGAYTSSPPDFLNRRITQICNYIATIIEREGIEDYESAIGETLALGTWPAQLLGIQCAARHDVKSLKEEISKLGTSRQQIPAWGERKTLGQLAREASSGL